MRGLRSYILKADGRKRPLGIAAVEDKIVQRAISDILTQIYEVDFKGFSYGFRPGRGCHNALDALYMAITTRKVNWILDADIQGFFDNISHDCMVRFLERRIADRRVLRLVRKWLKAGVMEEGKWQEGELGTPQGSVISPLLANVYLHYALDEWVSNWRRTLARGEVCIVRYADDFVIGFQYKDDAERFLIALRSRLGEFALNLHPEKTRLIQFGRFAMDDRRKANRGKPETFDFLGFTHICSVTRKTRKFKLERRTIGKRLKAKLRELKIGLRKRINFRVDMVGQWLGSVVRGYFNYFAIPENLAVLGQFRYILGHAWMKVICRRSNRMKMTWDKFVKIMDKWLPKPKAAHPYNDQRWAYK
jgi:group II intron reverse transcriptase/maturase